MRLNCSTRRFMLGSWMRLGSGVCPFTWFWLMAFTVASWRGWNSSCTCTLQLRGRGWGRVGRGGGRGGEGRRFFQNHAEHHTEQSMRLQPITTASQWQGRLMCFQCVHMHLSARERRWREQPSLHSKLQSCHQCLSLTDSCVAYIKTFCPVA